MAMTCTVCRHTDRAAIDSALVAGESVRSVASRYVTLSGRSLGHMALYRHKDEHLPASLAKAQEAASVAQADDLLAQVRMMQGRALGILDQAEAAGQLLVALAAIREARGCLELLGKLMGELDDRPQVNLTISPEWLAVRGVLLETLAAYPDARSAVAARLFTFDTRSGHAGN